MEQKKPWTVSERCNHNCVWWGGEGRVGEGLDCLSKKISFPWRYERDDVILLTRSHATTIYFGEFLPQSTFWPDQQFIFTLRNKRRHTFHTQELARAHKHTRTRTYALAHTTRCLPRTRHVKVNSMWVQMLWTSHLPLKLYSPPLAIRWQEKKRSSIKQLPQSVRWHHEEPVNF